MTKVQLVVMNVVGVDDGLKRAPKLTSCHVCAATAVV